MLALPTWLLWIIHGVGRRRARRTGRLEVTGVGRRAAAARHVECLFAYLFPPSERMGEDGGSGWGPLGSGRHVLGLSLLPSGTAAPSGGTPGRAQGGRRPGADSHTGPPCARGRQPFMGFLDAFTTLLPYALLGYSKSTVAAWAK